MKYILNQNVGYVSIQQQMEQQRGVSIHWHSDVSHYKRQYYSKIRLNESEMSVAADTMKRRQRLSRSEDKIIAEKSDYFLHYIHLSV